MSEVSVRALKDGLSGFLRRAEAGERIVVLRGGRPVAALVPIEDVRERDEVSILAGLARAGSIALPDLDRSRPFAGPLVPARGRDAAQMVVEDRG